MSMHQVCDVEFKPDLTDKICQLVQRFAPEKRWQIDSLLQVQQHSSHASTKHDGKAAQLDGDAPTALDSCIDRAKRPHASLIGSRNNRNTRSARR